MPPNTRITAFLSCLADVINISGERSVCHRTYTSEFLR
jgi:hypothetical protein